MLMINKSKKHELNFVKILAEDVIKPLLDNFISGKGWINLLKTNAIQSTQNLKKTNNHTCNVCKKVFCSEKTLKNLH